MGQVANRNPATCSFLFCARTQRPRKLAHSSQSMKS